MAIITFKIITLGKSTVIFQKHFNDFLVHIFGVFLFQCIYFSLTKLQKSRNTNIKHSNLNITLC